MIESAVANLATGKSALKNPAQWNDQNIAPVWQEFLAQIKHIGMLMRCARHGHFGQVRFCDLYRIILSGNNKDLFKKPSAVWREQIQHKKDVREEMSPEMGRHWKLLELENDVLLKLDEMQHVASMAATPCDLPRDRYRVEAIGLMATELERKCFDVLMAAGKYRVYREAK